MPLLDCRRPGPVRARLVPARVLRADPACAWSPAAAGVRADRGLGRRRGTLVTANHVSWLDIPAVLAVEPMRVLAKSDVRRWPVIGLLAARGGTLFIDRERLRRLPGTVAEIADALRGGRERARLPRGHAPGAAGPRAGSTRPCSGRDRRRRAGTTGSLRYRLADGTPTTVAAFVGDDTLFASVWRVVATRGLVVELEAEPVDHAARPRPPRRPTPPRRHRLRASDSQPPQDARSAALRQPVSHRP